MTHDEGSPMRALLPTAPLVALCLLSGPVLAQNGDRNGEVQAPLPEDLVVPPAPILSPAAQRETFALEPGLVAELVAEEPLVVDPVQIVFDERGRLWVCEMRGYMRDADANGEAEPIGCVAWLEDTDGDGKMDVRHDFLTDLVLPRAIQPTRGGLLVITPPVLMFAQDTDDDGVADEVEVLETGMNGIANPEHAINGLVYGLDNWFRCAKSNARYRWEGDRLVRGVTAGGGQWGVAFDAWGRAFYNTNPDPLRGDPFPSHYTVRNPNHGTASGANRGYVRDKSVWPSRINPGVNRGYQPNTLRDDYTLRVNTGACSPAIILGDALGPDLKGSAVVCEPTGNLLSRFTLQQKDPVELEAVRPLPGVELLTSTDERFRPVALANGPDGALYVADFARGLIQHRLFLTTFLRRQAEERGLVEPHALGRIWRVRHEDATERGWVDMSSWSWSELVAALDSSNGWTRLTAQRVLVEEGRGEPFLREDLEGLFRGEATRPEGRAHALWTLEGLGELRPAFLAEALAHPDGRVQAQAVRVAEALLSTGNEALTEAVARLARGKADEALRHQVLLSLGSAVSRAADGALLELAALRPPSDRDRNALISGLYKRELEFLLELVDHPRLEARSGGHERLLEALARCVVREGSEERIAVLLAEAASHGGSRTWVRDALCRGILAARPGGKGGKPAPVRVAHPLEGCAALDEAASEAEDDVARAAAAAFAWPGRPGYEEWDVRPLSEDEARLFERGAEIYGQVCAACHQPSGLGDPGQAPPLRGQRIPLGDGARFAALLLHGMGGPIQVAGETWDAEMPALAMEDADIAAVATYVRRAWGHGADPVLPETVRAVREKTAERRTPWTIEDLDAFQP
jgi:mono/diheme cytochrome c family protein/glucose/arabinose dehydrogenase